MRTLSIDIETYSSVVLKISGVYKYVESSDFAILMLAYAFDNEEVRIIDLARGEKMTVQVLSALHNVNIKKTAHNAAFERLCINKHFGIDIPVSQWSCTMVKASMLGLPLSLETVAKVLHLSEQKDTEGKNLIRFFCQPCKPSKANGMRTRSLPEHDPVKWEIFLAYCKQDVVTERAIRNRVDFFQVPAMEEDLYNLDQTINDTGVLLDPVFINNAITIDAEYRERLTAEAIELTGLRNPNSVAQLKRWIEAETDETVTALKKDDVTALLDKSDNKAVQRLLTIRQEISKTSIKKYIAMTEVFEAVIREQEGCYSSMVQTVQAVGPVA